MKVRAMSKAAKLRLLLILLLAPFQVVDFPVAPLGEAHAKKGRQKKKSRKKNACKRNNNGGKERHESTSSGELSFTKPVQVGASADVRVGRSGVGSDRLPNSNVPTLDRKRLEEKINSILAARAKEEQLTPATGDQ